MKKILTKIFSILGILVLSAGWLLIPSQTANSAQDCDSNAILYCGINSRTNLKYKLENGVPGRQYQSAKELQDLFGYYRIYAKDVYSPNLVEGYVTKDNRVVVPGRAVTNGYNVYSMGRSYMPGSTRVTRFSYPIYLRHPSVSFRSNSIPAYVYMNPDNTFAYAVIKSCGNIVPGKLYTEPTYKLTTWKYEDSDRDRQHDANEPMLAGWVFDVTGPNGYRKTITTSPNGGLTLTQLKKGTYTITERQQRGWESTTGLSRSVTITNANQSVWFGNARIIPEVSRYWLEIRKFFDEDRDGARDLGENYLAGWEFRVQGLDNNFDGTVRTGVTGSVRITNLEAGRYRVTEVSQPNWITITNPIQTINLTTNRTFEFGNYLPDPRVELRVVKFHDRDGDAILDGNEEGLSGWRFRVTGPNGFERVVTTDFSGDYTLTNLEPGNYIVTEILEDGWQNTTGLTISRSVTESTSTQVFTFGNRRIDTPETPGGGDLPSSGPAETAAMAFGSFSLSGGALAWLRSKKNLLAAFRR